MRARRCSQCKTVSVLPLACCGLAACCRATWTSRKVVQTAHVQVVHLQHHQKSRTRCLFEVVTLQDSNTVWHHQLRNWKKSSPSSAKCVFSNPHLCSLKCLAERSVNQLPFVSKRGDHTKLRPFLGEQGNSTWNCAMERPMAVFCNCDVSSGVLPGQPIQQPQQIHGHQAGHVRSLRVRRICSSLCCIVLNFLRRNCSGHPR